MLKLGSEGCLVYQRDGDRVFRIPALRADVLDTTGAGECLCGAFMAALVHGGDLEAAARAGQLLCQRTDGGPSRACPEEVIWGLRNRRC